KKPHENWGWRAGVLSREEHATSSAWEGSLANGIAADHSGGTTADSHGTSPLPEPASCKNSLRCDGGSVNEMEKFVMGQFPIRRPGCLRRPQKARCRAICFKALAVAGNQRVDYH